MPPAAQRGGAARRRWLVRAELERRPTLAALVAAVATGSMPFVLRGRWGLPADAAEVARTTVVGVDPADVLAPPAPGEDPFAAFDALPTLAEPAPTGAIGGGLVGWLGYDLGRAVERTVGPQPPRPWPLPTRRLGWYDDVLRCDEHGVWWVEALLPEPDVAPRAARLAAIVAAWRDRLDAAPAPATASLGALTVHRGAATHRAAVAETIERIHAGELFQANVCLRLEGTVAGAPSGLVAPVLEQTDPWYGAWIADGAGHAILSASPELFLRRRGRHVVTGPIKGTAPRVNGPNVSVGQHNPDVQPLLDPQAQALVASTKDRAEHVMIVDLMRNDLGRVCDYGSVRPQPEPQVQAHAGVWHLVTAVEGTLHDGLGDAKLLRAAFPPGSVTGAPKVQAMELIASVEGSGRELYTGAHGLASPASGLELAVAIRTLEFSGQQAWLGVGGGIVADSSPAGELAEALTKAAAIVAAAGGSFAVDAADATATAAATSAADALRALPHLGSRAHRPNPAAGLLETLLVDEGRPQQRAAHLARLGRSCRALGWPPPPADLDDQLCERAAIARGPARLRLLARPAGGRLDVALELVAHTPRGAVPVVLAPYVLPGGIGPHKWLDRTLLDRLTAELGATPLLLDSDGTLLEAAWANIWWLEDDALCTPPLDGRQLPGITRGVLLERAGPAGLTVREVARRWDASLQTLPLLLTSAAGVAVATLPETSRAVVQQAAALATALTPLTAGD